MFSARFRDKPKNSFAAAVTGAANTNSHRIFFELAIVSSIDQILVWSVSKSLCHSMW